MIYKLSKRIAFYFVKEGIVEKDEEDIYRFGVETILSGIFDIGIVLLSGILFQRLFSSIWYYFVFCILRYLAEGYHARTFAMCKIMMFGMMCLVLKLSNIGFSINIVYVAISTIFLTCMIWKVPTKCKKEIMIFAYFWGEVYFMFYKRNLAILTMIAFFIVIIASNIQQIKEEFDESKTEEKVS